MAHCAAQGKIGSGFDVSAAIFGTHVYSRFSPSLLDKALNEVKRISVAKKNDCFL